MKNLLTTLALCLWLVPMVSRGEEPAWEIESLSSKNEFIYDLRSGAATGTNGVLVRYGGATMIADRIQVDQQSGEAVADGNVRIQREDQVWRSEEHTSELQSRGLISYAVF